MWRVNTLPAVSSLARAPSFLQALVENSFTIFFACTILLTVNHADRQTNPTEKITSSAEVMTPFSYIALAWINGSSKYKSLPASFSFPFLSQSSHHGNASAGVTPLLLLRSGFPLILDPRSLGGLQLNFKLRRWRSSWNATQLEVPRLPAGKKKTLS